jgi:hypothetical protein
MFDWDDEAKPLTLGTSLFLCIQSQVFFEDKTSYHDVSVSGDTFVQLEDHVKVGSVDF